VEQGEGDSILLALFELFSRIRTGAFPTAMAARRAILTIRPQRG